MTTSVVPFITDALLALLREKADGVPVFESWPGDTESQAERIVFGSTEWEIYEVPTIKVGRKQRQEEFGVAFEVWMLNPVGTSPGDPKAARDRCFEIFATIENALANDITGGSDFAHVQQVQVRPTSSGPRKFERGWGYRVAGEIAVKARLV